MGLGREGGVSDDLPLARRRDQSDGLLALRQGQPGMLGIAIPSSSTAIKPVRRPDRLKHFAMS